MLFIDRSLLNLSASTAIDRIDSPETALLLQRFSLRGPKNCGHNWAKPFLWSHHNKILLKIVLIMENIVGGMAAPSKLAVEPILLGCRLE